MTHPPVAIAMGDQLHAEITERGNTAVKQMVANQQATLNEDEMMLTEIGVQAGLHAALQILAERGWIRIEVQP